MYRDVSARETMIRSSLVLLFLLGLIIAGPKSQALDNFEIEAGGFWSLVDTVDLLDPRIKTSALGAYGALWWNRTWGLRGALHRIPEDQVDQAPNDQFQVDIQRRLQSPVSDSYLSAGLGWEKNRFGSQGSLSAGGRAHLPGVVSVYINTGWSPNLKHLGTRQDVSTISVETGLVIEPMPFISLRAAYRYHLTDYTESVTGHDRREVTDGFHFGGGIHW